MSIFDRHQTLTGPDDGYGPTLVCHDPADKGLIAYVGHARLYVAPAG